MNSKPHDGVSFLFVHAVNNGLHDFVAVNESGLRVDDFPALDVHVIVHSAVHLYPDGDSNIVINAWS